MQSFFPLAFMITCICFIDAAQSYSPSHMAQGGDSSRPPIPAAPSELFQSMARSQLELLANSLVIESDIDNIHEHKIRRNAVPFNSNQKMSKIESMALYLPQENTRTGQLEFAPVILYPNPTSERVFIASDSDSKKAPTLPKTLTMLPGFAHASELLPAYPMIQHSDKNPPGVGTVEEVWCDLKTGAAALSVPLLSGSMTVGVLLVSPKTGKSIQYGSVIRWTDRDREQVSLAAQSLSVALCMDGERNRLQRQNDDIRIGLSDSLHQVKNPLQALRTYGKLLERRIASTSRINSRNAPRPGGTQRITKGDATSRDDQLVTAQLLALTERLMVQSDRIIDLLVPMDRLVEQLEKQHLLQPAPPYSLKPAEDPLPPLVLYDGGKRKSTGNSVMRSNNGIVEANKNTVVDPVSSSGRYDAPSESGSQQTSGVIRPYEREVLSHESASSAAQPQAAASVVGEIEVEMVFIYDLLEPVLSAFEAISEERGIEFDVVIDGDDPDDLPGVLAGPKALQEAITNVLDNACKYVAVNNPRPPPRVRVLLSDNEDGPAGVTIRIQDNGVGIAPADRESIFQRGFRSDATNGSVDGSGIGLDISRSLIERMGGKLEIEGSDRADQLGGASFRCTLYRKAQTRNN